MASTIKYDKIGDDGIYAGFPAKRLTPEEIKKIIAEETNLGIARALSRIMKK